MKRAMKVAEADQRQIGLISKGQRAQMGFNTVDDVIRKVRQGQVKIEVSGGQMVRPVDVAAELFCKRPSRTGLVYADFGDEHIVDDMEIGAYWRRYRSFDFGFNSPWVCLYIAVDPMDRVYIYDEVYMTGETTEQMALEITGRERDVSYEFSAADISGASDRRTLYLNGIPTWAYTSKVIDGIQLVKNALKRRPDGKPGFFVSRECPYTIWEMNQGYRYRDDKVDDNPKKENDHACDCIKNWFVTYNMGEPRQERGIYW